MTNGWKRQVSSHQQFTARRGLLQKADPNANRLFGVMFETIVPIGMIEADRKQGVSGEGQPLTTGVEVNNTVPRSVSAGQLGDNSRRHLALRIEGLQIAAIVLDELRGSGTKYFRHRRG